MFAHLGAFYSNVDVVGLKMDEEETFQLIGWTNDAGDFPSRPV